MPPPILPDEVRAALLAGRGLIRAADFDTGPGSRSRLHRLERAGVLVCLAKGMYTDAGALGRTDEWSRFRLRTRAFLAAAAPDSNASDWSSIVLQTTGRPPRVPSVIRPGSRSSGSNLTRHGRTRFARVAQRWLGESDGCAAVAPAFAVADVARQAGPLTGLMLADAVAFRRRGREELAGALADVERWRGAARADWPVRHCDPDVESPLESAGRLCFLRAGLPPSLSHVWVGEFVPEARLDHFWPEARVAAEGDGLNKYLNKYLNKDPITALPKEKEREWLLERMGIRVVRYTWAVATRSPDLLADRVRELLLAPPTSTCPLRMWPRDEGLGMLGLPSGRPPVQNPASAGSSSHHAGRR